jgi:hypothetical protein
MELIPYNEFARLRMKQFAPAGTEVYETDSCSWEWMGGLWLNEGICGFTSLSRHEDCPDETGGLEVGFRDLSPSGVLAIFDAIHLPLRPGMTLEEVKSILGEPEQTHVFVADRKSHDFTVGSQYPYHVSATIQASDGLVHVTVIRKDVLSKCDA